MLATPRCENAVYVWVWVVELLLGLWVGTFGYWHFVGLQTRFHMLAHAGVGFVYIAYIYVFGFCNVYRWEEECWVMMHEMQNDHNVAVSL